MDAHRSNYFFISIAKNYHVTGLLQRRIQLSYRWTDRNIKESDCRYERKLADAPETARSRPTALSIRVAGVFFPFLVHRAKKAANSHARRVGKAGTSATSGRSGSAKHDPSLNGPQAGRVNYSLGTNSFRDTRVPEHVPLLQLNKSARTYRT
ncbi:hypothetical protein FSB08_25120 [Paraburkholderia sp. JPY432]|uniref:hypothetical protein n=1 Tax=Paraburkholderia youngii TaxID=2782701 RepID=UPI0015953DF6|nr:hypothetical protein [Paraburkholderia youngii]NVH75732.1 hypothetical protein [Paraburkholderia youngii]